MYLTDLLKRNAISHGAKAALVFHGQSISWQELWQKVEAAALMLSDYLGSQEQSVVALLAPNSIDFVVAYLAVIHSGHIVLPLDPAYKQLELDAIIDQIPSKLIIVADDYRNQISDHHEPIVTTEDLMAAPAAKMPKNYLRLSANRQIAALTFTSGTTGRPKAVPNTHANHLWNVKVCSEAWSWTGEDTLLVSLPLSHWYGIVMGIAAFLYHGNTMYLQRWFDEKETLKALATGNISIFQHVATAFVKLIESPGEYDLSNVRLCVSGGAPLPPSVWKEFKRRFGNEILETYGSSETGRIAGNRLDDRILGSPGKIFPQVSLKLSEENEVLIKSPGVFPGYYLNPEATAASLMPGGYWRTGDIGEVKEGYVFLKGRAQERIRRFGYTISPRDVEWALHQHPKIKDASVIGVQKTGQPNDSLVYFLVTDLSVDEIKVYCRQNLLFAWHPDKVIILSELPRTRNGKTMIGELKQIAEKRLV